MAKKLVSHILLKHQFEAEDLLRKLKSGEDFNTLAKKFSICSSASMGGQLGEFKASRFVEEFTEAAEVLKPGEVSAPVRSRFGYHLIRIEEV